jgi:hypothetical protein
MALAIFVLRAQFRSEGGEGKEVVSNYACHNFVGASAWELGVRFVWLDSLVHAVVSKSQEHARNLPRSTIGYSLSSGLAPSAVDDPGGYGYWPDTATRCSGVGICCQPCLWRFPGGPGRDQLAKVSWSGQESHLGAAE